MAINCEISVARLKAFLVLCFQPLFVCISLDCMYSDVNVGKINYVNI